MRSRTLALAIAVLAVATLQQARPDDRAVAQSSPSVMPSLSVSTDVRTIELRGKRFLVVRSVTVTGVRRSVQLGIRCRRCQRLRGSKTRFRKTATSRRYTGVNWVLPRGRGISVDAIDAGALGRWTILGRGRKNPGKLVFKGSGCLRALGSLRRKPIRFRRVKCPAGTTLPQSEGAVPATPPAPAPAPPPVAPPPPPPPPPPPAAAPPPPDRICCGATLRGAANERIISKDGRYELRMQVDGNFVLYYRAVTPLHATWESNTDGSGADRAVMQQDGNLVLYRGGTAIWQSNTDGFPGGTLVVQNDGNVVIYEGGVARWASGTAGVT